MYRVTYDFGVMFRKEIWEVLRSITSITGSVSKMKSFMCYDPRVCSTSHLKVTGMVKVHCPDSLVIIPCDFDFKLIYFVLHKVSSQFVVPI